MCGDQGDDYDLHLWLYTTVMTLQGKELLEKGPPSIHKSCILQH